MCNDHTCFTAYKKLPTSIDIRLGDKAIVRVTHHGTVNLRGIKITALYTHTFRVSLLSIGQLDDARYTATFRQGACTIGAPGASTITGRKRGSIYVINGLSIFPLEHSLAAYTSEAAIQKSANLEKRKIKQRRPTATMPDAMMPDAMMSDAMIPDTMMPNATMPDVTMPDATMPNVTIPDVMIWHRRLAHLHLAELRSLISGIRVPYNKEQCDMCVQAKHKQVYPYDGEASNQAL